MSAAARRLLAPFAATRAGLLLAGLLGLHLLVSGLTVQKGNLVFHAPGPAALEIWARWDAEWYLLIAEHGYRSAQLLPDGGVAYADGDATGFFPLYPLLIRGGMLLGLSPLLAGLLISNLALLAAMRSLRELVRADLGEETADRSLWILLTFPTSLFLSAVYAESLMLAFLLGAIRLARRDRPFGAGILGALCALSRPTGVLVLIPLLDEALVRRRPDRWRRTLARGLQAGGPPIAALSAYCLYCYSLFGSLVPFLWRQERWRGPTSGPWRAFLRYSESPQVHGAHGSTIDLVIALMLVASIPLLYRRLRRSYALYATAAILLPLCSTLWSFSRFAATIFPVHVLLAAFTARSERLYAAYMSLALPLGGLFMALYAAWWWVG